MKKFFLFIPLLSCICFSAQEKVIDTVFLFDNQQKSSEKTQSVLTLKNEDIKKNATNLSEVLRFQSSVYIKENGRGAVSSPSFRGTSAQQTAFIWNGLNINSLFLGQGDVNNLGLLDYDQIDIKSGGGSVIYGSAAIGGSIHLNNYTKYNKGFQQKLFVEYGSFQTINSQLVSSFSNENLSVKFSAGLSDSENQYKIEEKDYENFNGQYQNETISLEAAYKFSNRNQISWLTQFVDGSQNFPIFTENGNKTKYETSSARNLLSYEYNSAKIKNIFRLAYLEENFDYFADIDGPKSSGGTGKNYIIKNDVTYQVGKQFNVNLVGEFRKEEAQGFGSGIENPSRNVGSGAILFRYSPSEKLYLEGGIKKDIIENLTTPILYSFGSSYQVSNWYQLKLNISKNFRYPSFNDLYFQPGGNLDLKPETAYQGELSNNFKYKNLTLNVMPYYIYINDMIRWMPTAKGYWSPMNTNKVQSYGLETSLNYKKDWQNSGVNFKLGYAYTKSENLETKQQLSYVPFHKLFGNIDYNYRWISIFSQAMFNGFTYTSTNEDLASSLKEYLIINAGISVQPINHYTIGFRVNNLTNQIYETTRFFVMPKRNYAINISLNF
ncbi:TonB-dependent receptor plug domain-containing protein [Frigoriflavimonas asaccharolytica]|uniref:Iron complex outermembrane receptor protein n=1 Tax=Frigoriflavimonas asaccharolytica TaxID=2735899 RepID=A0A8J8K4Y0_9FLAO|nr:TonB-dependent receptor [Frigoriflavimonas asaccharolytica]NRS92235.1 iron complex outermembrane receptor protein [Frigoriflavimonas asaccharolytica]